MASKLLEGAKSVYEATKSLANEVKTRVFGPSFRMLLIGETGSGKTSFLNLLCNSKLIEDLGTAVDADKLQKIRGYNDLKIESSAERAMASKTSEAKFYRAELCSMKITIIDTPGFGDSRGLEQDKVNVRKIIEALKGEDYINCVCLVINGRQARMSASLKYVLSEISTILPRQIFNNIVVVFTNTADPLDCNFDVNELEGYFGKKIDQDFYIENPYCRIEKAKQKVQQLSNDKIVESLQKSFEDTASCLKSLYFSIKDFEEVHTHHFIRLYKKKQEIEKNVIKLLAAYDAQTDLEKEIERKEEEVEAALKTKKLHNDFKTTKCVEVVKPVDTPDKRHNTLCGYPSCYSNCHMPCSLPKSYDKEMFRNCECMGGGTVCKVCHHDYTAHYHNEVVFKRIKETKEFVDEKMQSKFQEAKNMEEKAQVLRDGLQKQRESLLQKKDALLKELGAKITEFQALGISTQNYAKVLEKQRDVVLLRIEVTVGEEREQLNKFKVDLEKRLKVVSSALDKKN